MNRKMWPNEEKVAKEPPKTKIESRTIPPDIYDYLKKAKDEDDIEKRKSRHYGRA